MKNFVNLLFLCFYLLACSVCAHASTYGSSSPRHKKIKLYTAQINKNNNYGSLDILSYDDNDIACNMEDEDDECNNKKHDCLSKDALKILWPIFLNSDDVFKSIAHRPKTNQVPGSPLYIALMVLRI